MAGHLDAARALGNALAELTDYPEEYVAALCIGLTRLADDVYAAEQERVAPGSGAVFGVRAPLLDATMRQIRPALREGSPATALWLADRLAVEEEREFVFFCHQALDRSLEADPERSWQLMRQIARRATDWIRVDSLAAVWGRGILLESLRWSELEQLVYSMNRWERRLVGSTIAVLPFELPHTQRASLAGAPALELIRSLIGDAAPEVQKALSWALRSWLEVDRGGVTALLRSEAAVARANDDGYRAWVLRDALTAPTIDATLANEVRQQLDGVRRRPGGTSTSVAYGVASRFTDIERLSDAAIDAQGERQAHLKQRTAPRVPAGRT